MLNFGLYFMIPETQNPIPHDFISGTSFGVIPSAFGVLPEQLFGIGRVPAQHAGTWAE
jgi:hypothetical protein